MDLLACPQQFSLLRKLRNRLRTRPPLELGCILLSYAGPYFASLHPTELLQYVFRVGNFRQKNNSAEDEIDGTNGYFRRNSGCSAEQKISEFRSKSFPGRENNTELHSIEQKMKQTLGIPFRTLPLYFMPSAEGKKTFY